MTTQSTGPPAKLARRIRTRKKFNPELDSRGKSLQNSIGRTSAVIARRLSSARAAGFSEPTARPSDRDRPRSGSFRTTVVHKAFSSPKHLTIT